MAEETLKASLLCPEAHKKIPRLGEAAREASRRGRQWWVSEKGPARCSWGMVKTFTDLRRGNLDHASWYSPENGKNLEEGQIWLCAMSWPPQVLASQNPQAPVSVRAEEQLLSAQEWWGSGRKRHRSWGQAVQGAEATSQDWIYDHEQPRLMGNSVSPEHTDTMKDQMSPSSALALCKPPRNLRVTPETEKGLEVTEWGFETEP